MRRMHVQQSSRARGCLYFVLIDSDILGSKYFSETIKMCRLVLTFADRICGNA